MADQTSFPELPPEVLLLEAERLRAAGAADIATVLRTAFSYSFSSEFAESEIALNLCSFAEGYGVDRLLKLLQEAEEEVAGR